MCLDKVTLSVLLSGLLLHPPVCLCIFKRHKDSLAGLAGQSYFNHFHFSGFAFSRAAEGFQFKYLGDGDSLVPSSSMFWWIVTFTVENFFVLFK